MDREMSGKIYKEIFILCYFIRSSLNDSTHLCRKEGGEKVEYDREEEKGQGVEGEVWA